MLNIKVSDTAPALLGGISPGNAADKFRLEFGSVWRKTPVKGVYYVCSKTRNICFTVRGEEYGFYALSHEAFRNTFEKGCGCEVTYWAVMSTYKYPYLQLLKIIQSECEDSRIM